MHILFLIALITFKDKGGDLGEIIWLTKREGNSFK